MDAKRIALTVQEPVPGHFYWVLQQQDPHVGRTRAVASAPTPMPSYGLAMRAGMAAMERRTCNGSSIDEDDWRSARTDFGPTTIQ